MKNPFTPSFGQVPLQMAGRAQIIEKIQRAFDNGLGDPNLCSIFTGARGTGKTALLHLLANQAEASGWVSVSVTSVAGMLEDIYEQTIRKTRHLIESKSTAHIKQFSFGDILGVELEHEKQPNLNWRSRMTDVLDSLAQLETGLLITVDEVDPELDEIVQLATVYQHFVGENRNVSLLMAGLPHRVSSLLNGKSISFLRRANRVKLGRINDADVKVAFAQTAEIGTKQVSEKALKLATSAIDGFPFMLQLVGYYSWDFAGAGCIEVADVERGAKTAKDDMKERILQATLDELSDRDLDFLNAMLQDEKSSRTAEIASRIKMTTGNVSTYKKRLLEQGVIEESRRGEVRFALPHLREYLPEYCG